MHVFIAQPAWSIVLVMLAVAAVADLRTGEVPNAVAAAGASAGVLAKLLAVGLGHSSLANLVSSTLLGLAACSLVPLALYALGGLGGADVKLFAAIGLCLGPLDGLGVQFWTQLFAAACLPVYFWRTGGALRSLRISARLLANCVLPRRLRRPIDREQLSSFKLVPAMFAAALWVCVVRAGT